MPALRSRHAQSLGPFDEFNFVALGCVNERKAAALLHRWAVAELDAQLLKVFSKLGEAIHLLCEMREIRLNLHRAAGREVAELN